MLINGLNIPVDVRAELSLFDWKKANWDEPGWDGRKLQACSPFREDSRPSFYVWLVDVPEANAYAGQWGDSGGTEYIRGGFVSLLAFLRNETEEETEEYLLNKYAPGWEAGDRSVQHELIASMFATMKDTERKKVRKPLDISILKRYAYRHPYLTNRGISEQVQRAMRIGYDREKKMVTIPWFNRKGELVNIKRRSVTSKYFKYMPIKEGAHPVRELVYAIDIIHRKNIKEAVICEAEIDALYAMTAGIPAIATGGYKFSDKKAELIIRSPIERLIIAADNDDAGEKMASEIIEKLSGRVRLARATIPAGCKDLNDIKSLEGVVECIRNATSINAWDL